MANLILNDQKIKIKTAYFYINQKQYPCQTE